MSGSAAVDFPLLIAWEDFLTWLFPALEKLPKAVRFTLTTRMQGLALDILDGLVEARYRRDRAATLRETNLRLERLRVLVRVAHTLQHLAPGAYRHAAEKMDEAGRMLGGWLKSQERRDDGSPATACAG